MTKNRQQRHIAPGNGPLQENNGPKYTYIDPDQVNHGPYLIGIDGATIFANSN